MGLVDARPAHDKRKGPDTGVDGYIYFFDDQTGKAKTVIVQVKSGHVSVSQIRDLKGVIEREKAAIGVFITLEEPTQPMLREAAAAGFYESPAFPHRPFPRVQIVTIAELLAGKQIAYPRLDAGTGTFRKAPRRQKGSPQQEQLL
ncbi:MAG TPA: restriction endonuclease [Limnochorda sp.]